MGNSMNSTKYNTISNDTPSVTLPNVNRSQKDINPLDIEDFKTNNEKLIKNMQGSQSRMSKAVDGIISVLQESPDYSNLNKVNKSPLALNSLEVQQDRQASMKKKDKSSMLGAALTAPDTVQTIMDAPTIETLQVTISD